MKLSVSLLAAIAISVSGAAITPSDAAVPASSDLTVRAPEGSLTKRASMQVYLYEHINYGGAAASTLTLPTYDPRVSDSGSNSARLSY